MDVVTGCSHHRCEDSDVFITFCHQDVLSKNVRIRTFSSWTFLQRHFHDRRLSQDVTTTEVLTSDLMAKMSLTTDVRNKIFSPPKLGSGGSHHGRFYYEVLTTYVRVRILSPHSFRSGRSHHTR